MVVGRGLHIIGPDCGKDGPAQDTSALNPIMTPSLGLPNLIKDLMQFFKKLLDLPSLVAASNFTGVACFTCHLFKNAETQFLGTGTPVPFSVLLERPKERSLYGLVVFSLLNWLLEKKKEKNLSESPPKAAKKINFSSRLSFPPKCLSCKCQCQIFNGRLLPLSGANLGNFSRHLMTVEMDPLIFR